MTEKRPSGTKSRLIHVPRAGRVQPTVNPPIERASTLDLDDHRDLYTAPKTYGRMGLTVHRELEAALGELEGANHVTLTPSGLSACALAIASQVRAGDHVIASDSVYGPTRRFCQRRLRAMGVEASFVSPRMTADIADALRPNTRLIVMESPGSLTFELSDTPAVAAVAGDRGIRTIMDNTWGAGLYHRPLDHGVDISVQALTKYAVGHADAFGGAVMCRDTTVAGRVRAAAEDWGICQSADDAYLTLRGLRTLPTRLAAHQTAGLELARWLEQQPEVMSVLHPGLPSHMDHELWKRDFSGACGLFGVVLQPLGSSALEAFLDSLSLFGFGFSWGGYESLIIPCDPQLRRACPTDLPETRGPLLRLHVGLEDIADLMADLEAAFDALRSE